MGRSNARWHCAVGLALVLAGWILAQAGPLGGALWVVGQGLLAVALIPAFGLNPWTGAATAGLTVLWAAVTVEFWRMWVA